MYANASACVAFAYIYIYIYIALRELQSGDIAVQLTIVLEVIHDIKTILVSYLRTKSKRIHVQMRSFSGNVTLRYITTPLRQENISNLVAVLPKIQICMVVIAQIPIRSQY